jgi:hypothetical protein
VKYVVGVSSIEKLLLYIEYITKLKRRARNPKKSPFCVTFAPEGLETSIQNSFTVCVLKQLLTSNFKVFAKSALNNSF